MAALPSEKTEPALTFSDEETYFLKLAYLLLCHCPAAVRVCFDTEIHPTQLKKELNKNIGELRKVKTITKDQWKLMFPPGGGDPTSKSFDITLMIMLLRQIAKLEIIDEPPIIKEGPKTTGWALSTIKYYRNQLAHHSESGKISKEEVNIIFDRVNQAVSTLCPKMSTGCEQIWTADLSPSIVELIKDSLKHTQEIKMLQENQVSLQKQIDESQKIDGDALQIETWIQNDAVYVEPEVFTDMYKTVMDKHLVLITGVSGIGKTMSAIHLALKLMKEHGFITTPCDTLSDVFSKYKKDQWQTFVIDDICGKYKINLDKIENLLQKDSCIADIIGLKKTKIITTCRRDIYNEDLFPKNVLIVHSVYNLSEQYTDADKMLIAGQYLNADESQLLEIARSLTFSPLLCSVYSKSTEFRIQEFLDRPFKIICEELDRMKSLNEMKYSLLLLCVLQNGAFEAKLLTDDQQYRETVACVFEVCGLGRGTSRYKLLNMAEASLGTYLTKEGSIFKVIHDKIFDFLCGYFGKNMFSTIIRFADTTLLCERTVLSTFTDYTPYSFAIVVPDEGEDELFDRMKSDIIKNKKVQEWMGHLQKSEKALRLILNTYVEKIDDSKLSIVLDSINKSGLNPFTSSCLNGYEDLVRFFIKHGADVNAGNGWFTPLTAACREGHVEIVNMLITAGASVNKTGHFGETPLHVASIRGLIDIARVLVDNQANLHETNKYGQSPLYSSIMAGQNEMISYLIGKGALLNIDKIDKRDLYTLPNDLNVPYSIKAVCSVENTLVNEVFLLMAAAYGNVDLMEQIIKICPIDINYVNKDGDTSLHIASSRDFLKVAEILLSNGAEVDMVNKKGETPLHLACKNDQGEIVKLLIQNNALTSIKNKNNKSPRDIALFHDHKHIITILESLNVRQVSSCVDMRKIQDFFIPPFYKEILLNNFDVAKQMIKTGACVNIKTEDGDVPLAAACECGYGSIIQLLIENDADIKEAFHIAIKKMYVRAVRILISKYPRLIRETFEDESTPLIIACKKGNVDIIFSLLKGSNKLDINQINKEGVTALYVACESGNENVASELIRMGADVDQACSDGSTLLIEACRQQNVDVVKLVLNNTQKINYSNTEGKMALHVACENYNDEIVNRLITSGANVNQTFSDGFTPLMFACRDCNIHLVEILLESDNININHSNNEGKTALYIACEKHSDKVVSKLIFKGADVNQAVQLACRNMNARVIRLLHQQILLKININHLNHMDKLYFACVVDDVKTLCAVINDRVDINQTFSDGSTPLIISCTNGSKSVVNFLLDRCNVDINQSNNEGKTALYIASENYEYHFVSQLISVGADVNQTLMFACRNMNTRVIRLLRVKYRSTININHLNNNEKLCFACVVGDFRTLFEVINDKVNVNQTFSDGSTPLIVACRNGHVDAVRLLLESRNININHSNNEGETALHVACEYYSYNGEIVSELIVKGANINQTCSDGSTPLMIACKNGNLNSVKQFLEIIYVNVNHSNNDGKSALHMACEYNCDEIISRLIYEGANINQACSDVSTPLMIACKNGINRYAAVLLESSNVNINHSNNEDKTALHIACENYKCDDIVYRLIRKGANINQTCSDGSTPLILACRNENVGAVSLLLGCSNVNINHSNNEGKTALHAACKYNSFISKIIVSKLIVKGANINQTCSDGSTPLILACKNGSDLVVDILLAYNNRCNVDINHSNNEGKTALQIASETHNDKIVELLRKASKEH